LGINSIVPKKKKIIKCRKVKDLSNNKKLKNENKHSFDLTFIANSHKARESCEREHQKNGIEFIVHLKYTSLVTLIVLVRFLAIAVSTCQDISFDRASHKMQKVVVKRKEPKKGRQTKRNKLFLFRTPKFLLLQHKCFSFVERVVFFGYFHGIFL
jgi:hypothetical protein